MFKVLVLGNIELGWLGLGLIWKKNLLYKISFFFVDINLILSLDFFKGILK